MQCLCHGAAFSWVQNVNKEIKLVKHNFRDSVLGSTCHACYLRTPRVYRQH